MKNLYLLALLFYAFNPIGAQVLKDNNYQSVPISVNEETSDHHGDIKELYLHTATGDLTIEGTATKPTYQVYFILPIAFREQAPIWLDIQCEEMIDYRFVRLDPFNVFVAAQLNNSPNTIHLNWTSWVLIKHHDYSGIPASVPIPVLSELPDSVKPYLMPTGCVQWEDPFIKQTAETIRDTINDLIVLANKIKIYCRRIEQVFPVEPVSFDAYYAMRWGNSCTGHAHAGAALFRANGIPCRVLMNMPLGNKYDQHWIIEYYVPDYGWVKMETSAGSNPYSYGHMEIITFACQPEDEFSMTYPDNIESYWFASDTVFHHMYPYWGRAHSAYNSVYLTDSTAKVDLIISLTDSVYRYFTTYQGISLTSNQNSYFHAAREFQFKAFNHIKSGADDSLIYYLNQSLNNFRMIESNPVHTIFADNFENGGIGWTHGGIFDEWQIGTPTNCGPSSAYSGNNCCATRLDSLYGNNADCWLLSPSFSLNELSCAYLSVKIWNDVEDSSQCDSPKDKLWIELSVNNGETFFPITTHLGGVIDYNTGVPQVGGWSRLVLDLTPYVNNNCKIRFYFTSNSTITRPGSYIDDLRVYGKTKGPDGIHNNHENKLAIQCYPNPTSGKITIDVFNSKGKSDISILDTKGQKIREKKLHNGTSQFDVSDLPCGVYFVKVQDENGIKVERIIKK
jgi:hypothetical protein